MLPIEVRDGYLSHFDEFAENAIFFNQHVNLDDLHLDVEYFMFLFNHMLSNSTKNI
jgi:hypothetical protein